MEEQPTHVHPVEALEKPRPPRQCAQCKLWSVVRRIEEPCVCTEDTQVARLMREAAALAPRYFAEPFVPTTWTPRSHEASEETWRIRWVSGSGKPPRPDRRRVAQPKPGGCVRFGVVSDTHNLHRRVAMMRDEDEVDVLIHCGDASNRGTPEVLHDVDEWFAEQAAGRCVFVPGNHDVSLHPSLMHAQWFRFLPHEPGQVHLKHATVLRDAGVELHGVRVFGFPWVPEYRQWAFEAPADAMEALVDEVRGFSACL